MLGEMGSRLEKKCCIFYDQYIMVVIYIDLLIYHVNAIYSKRIIFLKIYFILITHGHYILVHIVIILTECCFILIRRYAISSIYSKKEGY